jgi:hypothetical protein
MAMRPDTLQTRKVSIMADTPLTKRMLIKPGSRVLVVNAPDGYLQKLEPLPENVTVQTERSSTDSYDCVQVFTYHKADILKYGAAALEAVRPDGLLWFAYPKKTGSIKTDIHRDVGWESVRDAGWEGIAMISIDDTWSAMRYRPADKVGRKSRS